MKSFIAVVVAMLLIGCITYDNYDDEYLALARVRLIKDSLITRSMVRVAITDGASQWQFGSGDFSHDPGYGTAWCAPEIETVTQGALVMRFRLRDRDGAVVSEGQVELPLKADWRWGISIRRDRSNPRYGCWGCAGSKSFLILDPAYRASEKDSIFVVWGGNSISNPVRY
jgi:hypothetical protein